MPKRPSGTNLSIFLLFCAPLISRAQDQPSVAKDAFDITSESLYYPHRFKPGDLKLELAISQVKLPFDWLETSVQAPLLHFHANYALPANFTLDGRFSSLIVANQITLGSRWQFMADRFSFNLGFDVAYAFGQLRQFGFDSSMDSWMNLPNASVGYRIDDICFTLKAEAMILTTLYMKQGDNFIETDRNINNGYTIAFYVEQRIHHNLVIVLGLKNSYAKYHFIGWPAFSTFNRFYNIPEVYIGFIL